MSNVNDLSMHKQLSTLLRHLADSLDISESHYKQAEDRYHAVGKWLARDKSNVAIFSPTIYPQGSFRLGTVIKPMTDTEEYDIDLVCELNLTKQQVSQKQLKELVGQEIKAYAQANNMKSRPENGRRCWTLNYVGDAQFHMDILPALPDGKAFMLLLEERGLSTDWPNLAVAITDKTLPNYEQIDADWLRSNPKGYAEWFKERMKIQFEAQRKFLAESIRAGVEDVPEYRVKTPLQRAVQILKRHRDIMFAEDMDDKPISIIITTLAAHSYNNEADLLEALSNIVNGMANYIQTRNGISWIANPVDPTENFADKWHEHPQRELKFRRWLLQVRGDLSSALEAGDIKAVGEFLKPRLGDKSINESLRLFQATGVGKTAGLTTAKQSLPSRFDVPHKQPPKWPIIPKGIVTVTGWYLRDGFRPQQFRSEAMLSKHYSLIFKAKTNIPWPYKVYWQVVNTGKEARDVNCLRGGFYDGEIKKGGRHRKESTLYTGSHWIECFIVKNGKCVARSGEFVVNIE
jgi:hypothetical protein